MEQTKDIDPTYDQTIHVVTWHRWSWPQLLLVLFMLLLCTAILASSIAA